MTHGKSYWHTDIPQDIYKYLQNKIINIYKIFNILYTALFYKKEMTQNSFYGWNTGEVEHINFEKDIIFLSGYLCLFASQTALQKIQHLIQSWFAHGWIPSGSLDF